jgi:hypothetical protein
MTQFFQVTPPGAHQMILTLERRGLIDDVTAASRPVTVFVAERIRLVTPISTGLLWPYPPWGSKQPMKFESLNAMNLCPYPPWGVKTAVAPLQTLIIKHLTRCVGRCDPLHIAVTMKKMAALHQGVRGRRRVSPRVTFGQYFD